MTGRVFVAGATGVLGRRVVPALVAAGYDVTANVRDATARSRVDEIGATPITVDLFDRDATTRLGDDHDAIVNVATAIPTGASAARRSAWAMNDRLRSEASANLAAAVARRDGRYVCESITFPYADAGDRWIDESQPRSYFWGNETCRGAEASASLVTETGGTGVALRFAMFFADDSGHVEAIRAAARTGVFALPGRPVDRVSWIHVDDAAAAVVAALRAPAGTYNVAEPDPVPRLDHAAALAGHVGRRRLRHLPGPVTRLAGPGVSSLARAHRISSRAFTAATGWEPRRSVVDAWSA
ncbi:MAG: NAD-dependent epimerase/dehydratase family protein [Actinomycetota bacterium]